MIQTQPSKVGWIITEIPKIKPHLLRISHIFGIKWYTWVKGFAVFEQLNFTSTVIN